MHIFSIISHDSQELMKFSENAIHIQDHRNTILSYKRIQGNWSLIREAGIIFAATRSFVVERVTQNFETA